MPTDPRGRSEVQTWLFAALNSVEMAALPMVAPDLFGHGRRRPDMGPVRRLSDRPSSSHGSLSWPDATGWPKPSQLPTSLMADVLRLVDRFDGLASYPACRAYVARAVARPAFIRSHADQLAHFAAAD